MLHGSNCAKQVPGAGVGAFVGNGVGAKVGGEVGAFVGLGVVGVPGGVGLGAVGAGPFRGSLAIQERPAM